MATHTVSTPLDILLYLIKHSRSLYMAKEQGFAAAAAFRWCLSPTFRRGNFSGSSGNMNFHPDPPLHPSLSRIIAAGGAWKNLWKRYTEQRSGRNDGKLPGKTITLRIRLINYEEWRRRGWRETALNIIIHRHAAIVAEHSFNDCADQIIALLPIGICI